MKCDELKSLWVYNRDINENCDEEFVNFAKENGYEELVEKKEVNEAIAELKDEIKRKEGVGQRWFEQCMEARTENARLKRALWIARCWFCGRSSEYFSGMASRCKIGQEDFYREVSERARKYLKSYLKCRAKAEEYK